MPRIVSRAEWGARKPQVPFATVPISARTATCVHHDGATPIVVRSFAEACARVRADEAYHMNHNGWAGIGYNYLVISAPGYPAIDGLIFEGRGRDVIGAHCLNWNKPWIGVQVAIGGGQTPSPAALASVRWLHDTFTAAAKRALGKKVHSDGFPTACPDPKLRTWVHAGMPVPKPTPPAPTTHPETTMYLLKSPTNPKVYKSDGFVKHWIGPAEYKDWAKVTGRGVVVVAQATLDAIPDAKP